MRCVFFLQTSTCIQINKNTKVKKKHYIFIIQNNNKNRKHIKIKNKKNKSFLKKLKNMNTLEAPRLPAAHHPSTDTAAFCPPRMGRKSIHHAMLSQLTTSQMPNLVGEMASKLWPVKFFIYKINQEWPSIHVPI